MKNITAIKYTCVTLAGGLTESNEDGTEDFSKNREMRQARVEVLFKDYEVSVIKSTLAIQFATVKRTIRLRQFVAK